MGFRDKDFRMPLDHSALRDQIALSMDSLVTSIAMGDCYFHMSKSLNSLKGDI